MSSVAPTDSVSSAGKKPRPGKRERQAARSAVGSSGGVPASFAKANTFAQGGGIDPVPQPGRFPVVFQTGVGEPSRDQEFTYSPKALSSVFSDLSPRYVDNPKFAEFREYSTMSDDDFRDWLTVVSLLRIAQQTVHAHVNMGLPQGDFASIASSEVLVPSSLSVVIQQFGELAIPSTGTRFLLKDYASAIKHLVWAADHINREGKAKETFESLWFPLAKNDGVTKLILAQSIASWFKTMHGVTPDVKKLEDAILSGTRPEYWESLKTFLGPVRAAGATGPDPRNRFDLFFKSYDTVDLARNAFTAAGVAANLTELGLTLDAQVIGRMTWSFNAKQSFSTIAEEWARVSASYAPFFELSSGLANRTSAQGSLAQLAQVTTNDGVSIVKTSMAVSAPELSLAVCFPPTALVSSEPERRVIVTTSLNVSQRATEFCLKDWR